MKKKASMLIGIGMPGLDIEKMMFDPSTDKSKFQVLQVLLKLKG
jgi:hypothetical protein